MFAPRPDVAVAEMRRVRGNRIGMVVPYCDLGLPAYQSAQGVEHFTLPYTAVPSVAGNDELILCYS